MSCDKKGNSFYSVLSYYKNSIIGWVKGYFKTNGINLGDSIHKMLLYENQIRFLDKNENGDDVELLFNAYDNGSCFEITPSVNGDAKKGRMRYYFLQEDWKLSGDNSDFYLGANTEPYYISKSDDNWADADVTEENILGDTSVSVEEVTFNVIRQGSLAVIGFTINIAGFTGNPTSDNPITFKYNIQTALDRFGVKFAVESYMRSASNFVLDGISGDYYASPFLYTALNSDGTIKFSNGGDSTNMPDKDFTKLTVNGVVFAKVKWL